MCGGGKPIEFRDFVVDAQEAHVAAENRQSDRQRAIQEIQFGKLLAAPCFAIREGVLCLLGFLAERFFTDGEP